MPQLSITQLITALKWVGSLTIASLVKESISLAFSHAKSKMVKEEKKGSTLELPDNTDDSCA